MTKLKICLAVISVTISTCCFAKKNESTVHDVVNSINLGTETDPGIAGDIIMPGKGVCDPHIHVFGDKAYLYASHDTGKGYDFYHMQNWHVYSSYDLVHWDLDFVLEPEDTFIGKTKTAFAIDAAERNGRHYLYFSNFNEETGVAVSTNGAAGPYIDALGKPLIAKDDTPNHDYDPTAFIDDDGTPYLVWGRTGDGEYYQIAELNDDMVSFAGPRRDLVVEGDKLKNDANFLHKHNGTYYLNTHLGEYATADNLFGPYTYRGTIAATGDHGTFFRWHNQDYYTWGEWEALYFRSTKITYVAYKDNGDIHAPENIGRSALGVGRYAADWDKIEAEWYFAAPDNISKNEIGSSVGDQQFEVRGIDHDTYLLFPRITNLRINSTFNFHVSSRHPEGGLIEIYEHGNEGVKYASCKVPSTGSWNNYTTIQCPIQNAPGPKSFYFVFKSNQKSPKEGEELIRFDWFSIDPGKHAYQE